MKRKVKKSVLYALSVMLLGVVIGGSYLLKESFKEDDTKYVSNPILENIVPVASVKNNIVRPYSDNSVAIINNYYDYKSDENAQINALIFYNDTYMQNTGIVYGADNSFDVIAIEDGEIIKISDSELSGKIVEIRHTNDIISVYQFMNDIDVSLNQQVKKGDKIGTSGKSNLVDNTKYQLYFELIVRGELVNPENYYDKNINEI